MYKYQSFSQYSLVNLLNDQIFMNHYEAFNDPFECWCEILTDFPTLSENSPRLREFLDAWGYNEVNDEVKGVYSDFVSSLKVDSSYPEKLVNAAKITCFSKRPDNLLMWSHYADGLRGFCIEFDSHSLLSNNSKLANLYDVQYQDKPAVIDMALASVYSDLAEHHNKVIESTTDESVIDFHDECLFNCVLSENAIYMKMLATKPLDWQYEEEKRVIYMASQNDDSLLNYPASSIKKVIFGEKMPQYQVKTIKDAILAKGLSPQFCQAKRAKGSFDVQIEEHI